MSETLNQNNPEQLSQPMPPMDIHETGPAPIPTVGPEAGAIDFKALASGAYSRAEALVGNTVYASRVAINGLKTWIAQKRMERAGTRMERMDHKDALYAHTAESLTSGRSDVTHLGRRPRPRTIGERYIDKRLDRKQLKKEYREADRAYVASAFAGERRSDTMGWRTRLASRREKREVNQAYKRGDIDGRQRSMRALEADTVLQQFENSEQRRTLKKENSSRKSMRRAIRQPVLSRWREVRRDRAVGTIQKIHRKYPSVVDA